MVFNTFKFRKVPSKNTSFYHVNYYDLLKELNLYRMTNNNLISYLQKSLPWESFLNSMKEFGFFVITNTAELIEEKDAENKNKHGFGMIISNLIHSGPLRDASLLYLLPYVIFRPFTEEQLKIIVKQARDYKIPISFCSGKTGLSGAYANYAILVDLINLHSLKNPITLNVESETVTVEQGVQVSDLIKQVPYNTNDEFIFPIQPSSAYKLPVRIGGIISTDASGITSGKLGSTKDWIKNIRIMDPEGHIEEITPLYPLYSKIVGGNGFYGVVLTATIKLYRPDKNLRSAIIYGTEINQAFQSLQKILDKKIFPLISEFVASLEFLPGKFKELSNHSISSQFIRWGTLIKGENETVQQFIDIMQKNSESSFINLTEEEFQTYLKERTKFGLLIQTEDNEEYLGFPGFEDILSEPKYLPEIIQKINDILKEYSFHPLIFTYGHINFRRGKGLLLHVRLPVPIKYFYRENTEKSKIICETVYEVINTLNLQFNIRYKAEHSGGPFKIWLDPKVRTQLRKDIEQGSAFLNPHLMMIDHLIREKYKISSEKELNILKDSIKKDLFISAMTLYLN
jgi:FAD/FMN-containing dehydrogenase